MHFYICPLFFRFSFAIRSMNRIMKSKERKQMQTCRDHKALQVCIGWKWAEVGGGGEGLFRTEPRSMWKINLHSESFLAEGGSSEESRREFPPSQVINKRINSFLRTISPLAAIPAHTNCLLSGRSNRSTGVPKSSSTRLCWRMLLARDITFFARIDWASALDTLHCALVAAFHYHFPLERGEVENAFPFAANFWQYHLPRQPKSRPILYGTANEAQGFHVQRLSMWPSGQLTSWLWSRLDICYQPGWRGSCNYCSLSTYIHKKKKTKRAVWWMRSRASQRVTLIRAAVMGRRLPPALDKYSI